MGILSAKYADGLDYPRRMRDINGYTQARDWISDQERWTEGFQLYNGQHAYIWVLDNPAGPKTGPGNWQPNPGCSGYGIACWNMKVDVDTGNTPPGW